MPGFFEDEPAEEENWDLGFEIQIDEDILNEEQSLDSAIERLLAAAQQEQNIQEEEGEQEDEGSADNTPPLQTHRNGSIDVNDADTDIDDEDSMVNIQFFKITNKNIQTKVVPQYDFDFSAGSAKGSPNMMRFVQSILKKGLSFQFKKKPVSWNFNHGGLYEVNGETEAMVKAMLEQGVIKKIKNPKCVSPLAMIRKANGKPRLIHDLRNVNLLLPKKKMFFPSTTKIHKLVRDNAFFMKTDLKNGYYHIKLAKL